MKCVFCGDELVDASRLEYLMCTNNSCLYAWDDMSTKVWQALIDGKKAQDALKEIVANPHGAACHNYQRAKKALEGK